MSTRVNMQVWGAPIAIGGVSLIGLSAALLADGMWDVVSWLALTVPVAVGLWCAIGPERAPSTSIRGGE
ncbi:hypothetical protein [Haliangium sp.]|uniref:hypothetical protein n=1 Tax=Haliangium sp. TaxID=2663208 RepID=UPI003D09A126